MNSLHLLAPGTLGDVSDPIGFQTPGVRPGTDELAFIEGRRRGCAQAPLSQGRSHQGL
jgi:hypothetical protein